MANRWQTLGSVLAVLTLHGAGFVMVIAAVVTVVAHWPLYLLPVFLAGAFGFNYAGVRLMQWHMRRAVRSADMAAQEPRGA